MAVRRRAQSPAPSYVAVRVISRVTAFSGPNPGHKGNELRHRRNGSSLRGHRMPVTPAVNAALGSVEIDARQDHDDQRNEWGFYP